MKKLIPLFFIVAMVAMSSCASIYNALYSPDAIKKDGGEMIHYMNVKAYEVMTPKVGDGNESKYNVTKQKQTTGSLIQYKTEDGQRYWYIKRDYREVENTPFIPEEMKLKQIGYDSEEYTGKSQDMSESKAYNYYCEDIETGKKYKIRRFPWSKGYGYFVALVADDGTIIYSLDVANLVYL